MKTTVNKTLINSLCNRWLGLLLGALTLAGTSRPAQAGGGNNNPTVMPPQAKFHGLSYGEWGAQWWEALLAISVEGGNHPFFTGGAFTGPKGILFLSPAYVVAGGASIDIAIPAGTPLFIPVINAECSVIEPDPFHGDTEAEMRACANENIDHTSGQFAEIDGVAVKDINAYRVQSPLFEYGPLPVDSILDLFYGMDFPGGISSSAVDAGYYLLLNPLSVGKHTIHVGGTYDDIAFAMDTIFNITVVPNKP